MIEIKACTADAESANGIRIYPVSLTNSQELADRLFSQAQRALRIERNPKGIGRKVEPGTLDIERLVLAGSLTTKADPTANDPEFQEPVWPTETDR